MELGRKNGPQLRHSFLISYAKKSGKRVERKNTRIDFLHNLWGNNVWADAKFHFYLTGNGLWEMDDQVPFFTPWQLLLGCFLWVLNFFSLTLAKFRRKSPGKKSQKSFFMVPLHFDRFLEFWSSPASALDHLFVSCKIASCPDEWTLSERVFVTFNDFKRVTRGAVRGLPMTQAMAKTIAMTFFP